MQDWKALCSPSVDILLSSFNRSLNGLNRVVTGFEHRFVRVHVCISWIIVFSVALALVMRSVSRDTFMGNFGIKSVVLLERLGRCSRYWVDQRVEPFK